MNHHQQILQLPTFPFRIKGGDSTQIFDRCRRKWISLTPEEWVRQHWIWTLIEYYYYPESLIRSESGLKTTGGNKRTDLIVGHPSRILLECKAPEVKLTHKTADQAFRYNLLIKAPYVVLSNGLEHLCYYLDAQKQTYVRIQSLPKYQDLD